MTKASYTSFVCIMLFNNQILFSMEPTQHKKIKKFVRQFKQPGKCPIEMVETEGQQTFKQHYGPLVPGTTTTRYHELIISRKKEAAKYVYESSIVHHFPIEEHIPDIFSEEEPQEKAAEHTYCQWHTLKAQWVVQVCKERSRRKLFKKIHNGRSKQKQLKIEASKGTSK